MAEPSPPAVPETDMANPDKPTVIVLGTVGHGKSTFMNRMADRNDCFEAARSVKGVTQFPRLVQTEHFNLIDTPGLNDKRIDTKDWVDRFNGGNGSTKPQDLALAILLFKKSDRPQRDDYVVLSMCKKAIENLAPQNVALVFTHCDESLNFDKDYAHQWYTEGIEHEDLGMPEVAKERIFLFKGNDGQGGTATTHNELADFIRSIIPAKEEQARLAQVDFAEFVKDGIDSQNAPLKEAIEAIVASMKLQNENLMAQVAQQREEAERNRADQTRQHEERLAQLREEHKRAQERNEELERAMARRFEKAQQQHGGRDADREQAAATGQTVRDQYLRLKQKLDQTIERSPVLAKKPHVEACKTLVAEFKNFLQAARNDGSIQGLQGDLQRDAMIFFAAIDGMRNEAMKRQLFDITRAMVNA